ncbi:DNA-repair protein XRCC1 [Rhynchospora pubera]|uniref:DNA-repair protein XRCC1 n=1 Tax=Rhynchospora pubera TaxID=906938 RepID=A0AAV8C319_9POAL|nr:DNA-repair protein XRCC1 [Rhynchospora pubera]
MPESSSHKGAGNKDDQPRRNLPSWMTSKGNEGNSGKKKKSDNHIPPQVIKEVKESGGSCSGDATKNDATDFSKFLDGVVFVLSGFVNPGRSNLRIQATDLGATFRPDWNPDCTLLVCAFANTPKFKQVQSDNGTIVSKEWISECHEKKKLVPIEPYLMHAGKPWRRQQKPKHESRVVDDKDSAARNVQKQVERAQGKAVQSEITAQRRDLDNVQRKFSPSQIKAMAKDDLIQTVSWLESQEEKPEADKIKEIAAEGVITCIQDAIESLQQNLGLNKVAEQWGIAPTVVRELVVIEKSMNASVSKEEIMEIAIKCKKIYESEFKRMDLSPDKAKKIESEGSDSDETIEMTEEEIDQACRSLPEYDV